MPPPLEARIKAADRWLKRNRQRHRLPRVLYLVPGLCDESGGCWDTVIDHGDDVFVDWDRFAFIVPFQKNGKFPDWAARRSDSMSTFWDFGQQVNQVIADSHEDSNSGVGEYDVLCHSMGGLDAFAALVENRPHQVAMAYNFIACDTPFRGIPNADARRFFPDIKDGSERDTQAKAIDEGSPELDAMLARTPALIDRVERMTCLRASEAIYVAVSQKSADLLADEERFSSRGTWQKARDEVRYRAATVPGAVHSGPDGLTKVRIGIVEIFRTLIGEV